MSNGKGRDLASEVKEKTSLRLKVYFPPFRLVSSELLVLLGKSKRPQYVHSHLSSSSGKQLKLPGEAVGKVSGGGGSALSSSHPPTCFWVPMAHPGLRQPGPIQSPVPGLR